MLASCSRCHARQVGEATQRSYAGTAGDVRGQRSHAAAGLTPAACRRRCRSSCHDSCGSSSCARSTRAAGSGAGSGACNGTFAVGGSRQGRRQRAWRRASGATRPASGGCAEGATATGAPRPAWRAAVVGPGGVSGAGRASGMWRPANVAQRRRWWQRQKRRRRRSGNQRRWRLGAGARRSGWPSGRLVRLQHADGGQQHRTPGDAAILC